MAVVERFHSRKARMGEGGFEELLGLITGVSTDDEARAAFLEWLPDTRTVEGNEIELSYAEVKIVNPTVWKGIGYYGDKDIPGTDVFSFEVGTATEHITQSVETVASYARSLIIDIPDYKGSIGVNEKGEVQGVDIFSPTYGSSERHVFEAAEVDNAYKQTIFNLVGKVADFAFKEYALGECLFIGASGSTKDNGDWEVSFNFSGRPNETNIDLGGVITVDEVQGWDYLWIQYEAVEDGTAKRIVRQPVFAYVERVYERGDMSDLGIGIT